MRFWMNCHLRTQIMPANKLAYLILCVVTDPCRDQHPWTTQWWIRSIAVWNIVRKRWYYSPVFPFLRLFSLFSVCYRIKQCIDPWNTDMYILLTIQFGRKHFVRFLNIVSVFCVNLFSYSLPLWHYVNGVDPYKIILLGPTRRPLLV